MIIHRGRRLGRQLHEGLANMPILKALALSTRLGTTASRVMWADLAKIPAILTLEHLRLAIFDSDLDDYTRFILKHSKTLNILATSRMGLHSGTLADLSIFYAELSKAPRLEDFCQYGLGVEGNDPAHYVQLPRHLCVPYVRFDEDEDEDGFIEVDVNDCLVRWKGQVEVKRVLAELAMHFGFR
jgi:hypothetical protein